VNDVVAALNLTVLTGRAGLDRECAGGYCSDLLSDVMAHARAGDVWITLQTHANVIAVAALTGAAAVVLTGGQRPEPPTLERAETEGVTILATTEDGFTVAGRLYGLLHS
jgi:predicted transcriptional regulator